MNDNNNTYKSSEEEELNEEQIEKVNEYRIKLNTELREMIDEEKAKEQKRDAVLKQLQTKKEKKKMEKLFGGERAKATKKLNDKNNEIQKKIEQYIKQLKKEESKKKITSNYGNKSKN